MPKVQSLRGDIVPETFGVHAGLVEELKYLLEAAQSGEVVGLAGAVMYRDQATAVKVVGLSNRATLGAMIIAQNILVEELN